MIFRAKWQEWLLKSPRLLCVKGLVNCWTVKLDKIFILSSTRNKKWKYEICLSWELNNFLLPKLHKVLVVPSIDQVRPWIGVRLVLHSSPFWPAMFQFSLTSWELADLFRSFNYFYCTQHTKIENSRTIVHFRSQHKHIGVRMKLSPIAFIVGVVCMTICFRAFRLLHSTLLYWLMLTFIYCTEVQFQSV